MKLSKNVLYMASAVCGSFFLCSLYLSLRSRGQDKKATAFLLELKKLIDPDGSGLSLETAFDIHYHRNIGRNINSRLVKLSQSQATQYAHDIHDAWGFWNDDEDKVFTIFRQLQDKVQVSQVAEAYAVQYSNLIEKLYDKLSNEEIKKVLQIVKRLPAYRTV